MPHVAVVIGGGALDRSVASTLPDGIVVIAADGGLDHAVEAGLSPSVLVGDLDSISAGGRMWAYEHGVRIEEHPADKDLTDTELALRTALTVPDVGNLLVLGGAGRDDHRPDHFLGTLLALGHPDLAAFGAVTAHLGGAWFNVVHPGRPVTLPIGAGRTFSVLALHGPVTGVTVRGAKWELDDAELSPTAALGVSNETKEDMMKVSTSSGVVTVVVP